MRTPPAYAIRPPVVVNRRPAKVSFAGQVADRILSVVEDVLFPGPKKGARRLRTAFAGLAVVLMAGGSVAGQPATPASAAVMPTLDHIFLIVMENHAYSQIIGSASAPYTNSLAEEYGLATQYTAITHPSLPNYLALAAGSTLGITGDCNPTGTGCSVPVPINAPHIGDAIDAVGKSWKAYQESMPVPATGCPGLSGSGTYAPRHNPFVYFTDVQTDVARCRSHIVPYTQLSTDLSAGGAPNFAFITPNLCNDTHDCSIATGDNWLKAEVPKLFGSTAFTRQKSLLVITWDEDDFTSVNKVVTMFVSPYAKPSFTSAVAYNHYSLLKSIEQGLGAGTVSTTTNDVAATPMGDFFGTPITHPALQFPIRSAFYYPWFPETFSGTPNPFSLYTPTLGYYSSDDPVVLSSQIRAMQYGGIRLGISSWWGPNGQSSSKTDYRLPLLLRMAQMRDINWSIYYEKEGQPTPPTTAQVTADLQYLQANYATDPAWLKIGGRFVVFVYNTEADPCSVSQRWHDANAAAGNIAYVVLKVAAGYANCAFQPDDWHQYNPDVHDNLTGNSSFSVSAGFWKAGESGPRLARDTTRYASDVSAMVASTSTHWHLVTTFNEWGEGTSVESATASTATCLAFVPAQQCSWSSASGYGQYLDILYARPEGSTPATVPGAPTSVTATAGDSQATVSWTPPTANGGSAITGYTVSWSGGSQPCAASPCTVTGLSNGTSYTFTVTATNAVGTGPASPPSNAVTPVLTTAPGAPTNVTATAGDSQATVRRR